MPRLEIATILLLAGALGLTGCDKADPPTGPSLSHSPAVSAAAAAVWTRVSAGGEHTCALATNGKAYCWGDAVLGQIGNGTTSLKLPEFSRSAKVSVESKT